MQPGYDFSLLDAPMSGPEAAARRREILGGRSILRDMSVLRGTLLAIMVLLGWPLIAVTVGVFVVSSLTWVFDRGPTADWGFGVPILLLVGLIEIAAGVVATRALFVPPVWRRWVRMHRFAEANGMSFIRRATQADLPGVEVEVAGVAVLEEVFSDPVAGLVLGNSGAGVGAQAFILVHPGGETPVPVDADPLDGFTVRETRDGRLATRYRPVPMRRSATLRRMFATAEYVRAGEFEAIR